MVRLWNPPRARDKDADVSTSANAVIKGVIRKWLRATMGNGVENLVHLTTFLPFWISGHSKDGGFFIYNLVRKLTFVKNIGSVG